MEQLAERLDLDVPNWPPETTLPGFAKTEIIRWSEHKKAHGWLLWLSGIYDDSDVYFWDTLPDQRKTPPRFGLPQIRFALDVVVGYKGDAEAFDYFK